MPLQRCELDGDPGWRWGNAASAKCYTFTPGDDASEMAARRKAMAQATAMGEFDMGVQHRAQGGRGNVDTADAGDLDADARRYCVERGWAMEDGSYPIRPVEMHGHTDLQKAIRAVGRGSGSHEAIRRHIMKRASAIGMMDMIPDSWTGGGESRSSDAVPVEILERRDSTVLSDDVDFKQRIIDVIAAPYDQEAEIMWRGEPWREVFTRSAFNGIEDHAGRIPVNREHLRGDTVGKVVRLDPYDSRGLLASLKIARTPRGDDTLQLASEGMLGASIGYFVKRGSDVELNRRAMLRRVRRAFLDHLAMTDSPAYVGAQTVAVRAELLAQQAAGKPLVTPSLDEFVADEVFAWAKTRSNRTSE